MKKRLDFTQEDEEFIRIYAGDMTDAEIGKEIGKTSRQVYYKRKAMGVTKQNFHGCDGNCFKCKYPDCYLPAYLAVEDTTKDGMRRILR